MLKADVICPKCNAGLRRIELSSLRSAKGEYRCPICEQVLEVFDGSKNCLSPHRTAVETLERLETSRPLGWRRCGAAPPASRSLRTMV